MSNTFKKPILSELTSRSFAEYRAKEDENNGAIIEGMPIVFGQPTDIGGLFQETIERGAIDEKLLKNVAFFYNHDLNTKPVCRSRTGKLKFEIKEDGVHMVANVNRERSDVNDLYLAIKDGDIDGMSFMFRVAEDEWQDMDTDYPKRSIKKISYVQEVSAVNYPAYEGTEINARTELDLDGAKKVLDEARAKYNDSLDSEKEAIEAEKRSKELELEKLKYEILYGGI